MSDGTSADAEASADAEELESAEEATPAETAFGVPVTWSHGQRVLHPSTDQLVETVEALRADDYVSVVDLCGVDYLEHMGRAVVDGVTAERFELVINLINHQRGERTRLRVQVPESDPTIPSLFDVFPGTEAQEREAYDMYGFNFENHPDHTRILMPDGWHGHPLRKDFAVGTVPVQFKGAPSAR